MPRRKKPTVLVVDDELDVLLPLVDLLAHAIPSARFYPTATATEALEYATEHPVDIVITDYRMPGMTGVELLRVLRQTPTNPDGILMTAFPSEGLAWRVGQSLPRRPVLTKPFDISVLTTLLTGLLANRANVRASIS